MSNSSIIDFQIFPSLYEQNKGGEVCCWVGGRDTSNNSRVTLQPYQTDAIPKHSNPEWGFHLLATGKPDEYSLKYVKMSDPLKYWYGVSVKEGKLVLLQWQVGVNFTVKKLGEYYTLQYPGGYVECENGNLGQSTTIQVYNVTPPTSAQVAKYEDIPAGSFRVLWKFVKMAHMSGRDWVAKLSADPNKSRLTLDRLFIPGTHDSGTEKNTQFNQTQFHTIPEQAAMGVRYFDLRVATNWEIYHGSYSGIWLNYVVNSVVDHLQRHPGEFFFLQITPEDCAFFSNRLYDYLKKECPGVFQYVYTGNTIPTLSDAKGKILFFSRYTPGNYNDPGYPFREYAISWPDNAAGNPAIYGPFPTPKVYVQDCYKNVGDFSKFKDYIKPLLYKMFPGTDPYWIVNFTSVANKYPIHSAQGINPSVADLLMWTHPSPSGILMVDDARVGYIAHMIALNFV